MEKRKQLQVILILLTCVLLAVVWLNEYLDIASLVFKLPPSPPNLMEALFESLMIIFLTIICIIIMTLSEKTIMQTQVEKEIARSDSSLHEQHFRTILQNAPFLTLIINRDYTVQYVNQAFESSLNIPRADISGESILSYIDSDFHVQARENFRKIFEQEAPIIKADSTYLDMKGNRVPVWESYSAILGKNKNPTQLLIMAEDRKLHKILAQQRKQSQKLHSMEKETKGFVHHYNNQLMVILGAATLLAEKNQDEESREYIEKIKNTADTAIELTRNLLSLSQNENFSVSSMDINQLIEKIKPALQESMGPIPISYKLFGEPLKIKCHGKLLENALLNLAINAREAMGDTGTLTIRTAFLEGNKEISGPCARIEISDSGPGIPDEIKEKIFDPFFTTKPSGTGAGLGLAAVTGAIQAHRGSITTENPADGGACFILNLPLVKSEFPTSRKDAPHIKEMNKKARLLLVDDEEGVRSVTKRLLTSMGYEVLEASSGEEALEIYKEYNLSIDGVLLDMIMPEMDGLYTFNEMKNINGNIKAILLSGYSMEEKSAELLKTGISDYIMKPVSKKELSNKVYQNFIDPS